MTRLKAFFDYCTKRGWLRHDPLQNVQRMKAPRKRRMQPEARVLMSLLDHAANARDRCYLAVAINTGLRASEITRLRVGDVDLDGGSLKVWISKTKEEDDQPITLMLDRELRRWLTTYAVEVGRPLHVEDYLFPARLGSRYAWRYAEDGVTKEKIRTKPSWMTKTQVQKTERIVQEALAAVGLPTKYEGTHTLRRAIARHFFDSQSALGYDGALRATSALLHHGSASTTERYLGLSSERKRRDEALRGKPFLEAGIDDNNVIDFPGAGEVKEA